MKVLNIFVASRRYGRNINVQCITEPIPTINVGALDDQYASGNKERKVNYSDMGNMIDLFAPADGSLAAYIGSNTSGVNRYDNTYSSIA